MSDWLKNKGAGPWAFSKQPDKWGYLNNKWWSIQIDAIAFNETLGYPTSHLDIDDRHIPCGHWHKPPLVGPQYTSFPVGKTYGWDSLLVEPYAFTWDQTYRNILKIDLNSLNAVDFCACNPTEPIPSYWVYQVLDICYKYIYEVFYMGDTLYIYKMDVDTMEIVAYNELYLGAGLGVVGGCADNQYLFLSVSGNLIASINTDLSNLVLSHVAEWGGGINGGRGLKLSLTGSPYPYYDMPHIMGVSTAGAKVMNSKDFDILAIYGNPSTGPFGPGGNIWEGNLQLPYAYGASDSTPWGFATIAYHPFYPRFYWFAIPLPVLDCGYPYCEHALMASPAWSDWSQDFMYVTETNFFGYTYGYQYLQQIGWGISATGNYFESLSTPENPINQQGTDLACNKVTGEPVTKTIVDINDPGAASTWLTKFDEDCDVLVWRHKVEGLKAEIPPAPLVLLEPQVWTMKRTF